MFLEGGRRAFIYNMVIISAPFAGMASEFYRHQERPYQTLEGLLGKKGTRCQSGFPLVIHMVPKGGLDRKSFGGSRHLLRSKLLANATHLSSSGIDQMPDGAASG